MDTKTIGGMGAIIRIGNTFRHQYDLIETTIS